MIIVINFISFILLGFFFLWTLLSLVNKKKWLFFNFYSLAFLWVKKKTKNKPSLFWFVNLIKWKKNYMYYLNSLKVKLSFLKKKKKINHDRRKTEKNKKGFFFWKKKIYQYIHQNKICIISKQFLYFSLSILFTFKQKQYTAW